MRLWGGDRVGASARDGEGAPIIHWMDELGLQNLLPRGTIVYETNEHESTIDLVFTTERLADEVMACGIWEQEYGSDHRAIRVEFDSMITKMEPETRLLFKHAN